MGPAAVINSGVATVAKGNTTREGIIQVNLWAWWCGVSGCIVVFLEEWTLDGWMSDTAKRLQ